MSGTQPTLRKKHSWQALQTQKKYRKRAALQLMAELPAANSGLPETCERLAEELCQIFDSEAGSILFVKDELGELVIKGAQLDKAAWVYNLSLARDNRLFESSILAEAPFLLDEIPPGAILSLFDSIPDFHPQSILSVPLVIDEQLLGAVIVVNKRSGQFTNADHELLALIAAVYAQALSTFRQIQALQVANADLEATRWQLLNSRNTLRTLFDSVPTSIYIIDQKCNLTAVNLHRAERSNDLPKLLVGKRCFEAFYRLDHICPGCRVMDTLLSGQSTTRTKRQWETEYEPQEWEISSYPILDDGGQVVQAILFEQDVTEKRRLEATLAQSEKLAAVGQLAAGIAHEINNPLTAVIANAQLLQRELLPEDDKYELVDLIARAGARATQVVRNLLDLSRKEQYKFEPVDLNETIRKSLELLQHEIISRSINLVFEPGKNLPKVIASQDHLQGVWINLFSNAIDALENDSDEIRVSTRLQAKEIRVMVTDTGKGIPSQQLSRIFEPFYTTKAPGRGTGLGLSVCHRVIKQHGGRILVDSQAGVGTQFSIFLPIS